MSLDQSRSMGLITANPHRVRVQDRSGGFAWALLKETKVVAIDNAEELNPTGRD